MLYVAITSVAIFPVVKQTQDFTDDVMLETIFKADMFILRNFINVLIMTFIFLVINYFIYKKNNKKYSFGLLIFLSLVFVINLVRVVMFYI
jgi:glycerol uptake facilitator-like aquaporin